MPEVLFDFEKMRQFKSDYFAQKTALTEPLHDIAKKINFQFLTSFTAETNMCCMCAKLKS